MPTRSRRAANNLATELLAKPRLAESDVLAVLQLWYFSQNKTRHNVLPPGVTSVCSDTIGSNINRGRTRPF